MVLYPFLLALFIFLYLYSKAVPPQLSPPKLLNIYYSHFKFIVELYKSKINIKNCIWKGKRKKLKLEINNNFLYNFRLKMPVFWYFRYFFQYLFLTIIVNIFFIYIYWRWFIFSHSELLKLTNFSEARINYLWYRKE